MWKGIFDASTARQRHHSMITSPNKRFRSQFLRSNSIITSSSFKIHMQVRFRAHHKKREWHINQFKQNFALWLYFICFTRGYFADCLSRSPLLEHPFDSINVLNKIHKKSYNWKCMKNVENVWKIHKKTFLVLFEDFPILWNTFGGVASSNCGENMFFLQKNLKTGFALDVIKIYSSKTMFHL